MVHALDADEVESGWQGMARSGVQVPMQYGLARFHAQGR